MPGQSADGESVEQLLIELNRLRQEVETLTAEKADLEILLDTTVDHSTHVEAELQTKNEAMEQFIQQVYRVTTAAAALEAGTFQPVMLDSVAARGDELGQLARVFRRMAEQVRAREERLKQQVQELQIEIDDVGRVEQVAKITQTDYFQGLKSKIRQLRTRDETD